MSAEEGPGYKMGKEEVGDRYMRGPEEEVLDGRASKRLNEKRQKLEEFLNFEVENKQKNLYSLHNFVIIVTIIRSTILDS